jgi:hypothetical protein
MFQYAFFLQMQQWHGKENVKLDIDTYHWKAHNGRELERVFRIDLKKDAAPVSLSLRMADVGYGFKNRLLRRLFGKRHRCYAFWKNLSFEDYRQHLPADIYLEGYWNEERYFSDVAGQVRSIYRFPEPADAANRDCMALVAASRSVGIHVRRGDYIRFPAVLPMCPVEYYRKAVDIIERNSREQDLQFFVFSDDMAWCRENLSFIKNVHFVDHNAKTASYNDMMLLSACKHQIMANSTFSWWAAWLNPNPAKIVVYPSTTGITYASMPESWTCIDS